jgi:hypothetical protein
MVPFAEWNLLQLSNYDQEWKEMEEQSREEYIGSLRRYTNSSKFWQVVLSVIRRPGNVTPQKFYPEISHTVFRAFSTQEKHWVLKRGVQV